MGKRCYLPSCFNRAKDKVSMFKVPRNLEERNEWSRSLNFPLKENSHICEVHFLPTNLIYNGLKVHGKDGQIVHKVLSSGKRLSKGAIPCLNIETSGEYNHLINYEEQQNHNQIELHHSDESSVLQTVEVFNTNQVNFENTNIENNLVLPEQVNRDILSCNKLENSSEGGSGIVTKIKPSAEKNNQSRINLNLSTIKRENNDVELCKNKIHEYEPYKCQEADCQHTEFQFVQCGPEISENNDHNYTQTKFALIDNILSGYYKIKLPNSQWAMHLCEKDKKVVFSYVEFVPSDLTQSILIPLTSKQVVLDKDIKFYCKSKNIELDSIKMPTTAEDLEEILKTIDSYNLCKGGPKISYYPNAGPIKAYKDRLNWRHSNCSFAIPRYEICHFCRNLDVMLSNYTHRKRKEQLNSKLRFNNSTPQAKERIKIIRKDDLKLSHKKIKRRDETIEKLND